ncbi:hypothetical protein [Antarctobacter sp.]|uniref:hypothetical protein n=1 Tax=Antarctobacter sp. TaxID=1872577 RepID=UPI002B277EDD|nr:hypothetical protein [Antarctobacter sp.]
MHLLGFLLTSIVALLLAQRMTYREASALIRNQRALPQFKRAVVRAMLRRTFILNFIGNVLFLFVLVFTGDGWFFVALPEIALVAILVLALLCVPALVLAVFLARKIAWEIRFGE